MRLRAPAKINLSFRIHGRRADGFHDIETLMAPVSLYDELTISRSGSSGEIQFTCDDRSLSVGEDNLVVRAARLFQATTGINAGIAIDLQKRIPHGAGLGGGSSDAASTLLGLNEVHEGGLQIEELGKLGAELGSDVPFFLFRSAAICRGRGEMVQPSALNGSLHFLLLKPAFGVPTPMAYARWKESRALPDVGYAAQDCCGQIFFNDLERPVFEKHIFLAHVKTWLREQPEVGAALLSGSGSTVFAILRDGTDADALAARATTELDPQLWTYRCESVAAAEVCAA